MQGSLSLISQFYEAEGVDDFFLDTKIIIIICSSLQIVGTGCNTCHWKIGISCLICKKNVIVEVEIRRECLHAKQW